MNYIYLRYKSRNLHDLSREAAIVSSLLVFEKWAFTNELSHFVIFNVDLTNDNIWVL